MDYDAGFFLGVMLMQLFITGASGFVGGAATRALLAAGHQVAAMSRSAKSDDVIRQLGAEPVRCDLESISSDDIGNADVVVHCAAFVEVWGPKDAWYKGNVLGTAAVLRAAQEAGVSRFVHMGTEAGIVHGQHINGADETYPLAPILLFPIAQQRLKLSSWYWRQIIPILRRLCCVHDLSGPR